MKNNTKYEPGALIGPANIELLEITKITSYGHKYALFKCPICGEPFEAKVYHVKDGKIVRCKNCKSKAQSGKNNPNYKNLIGKKYGKLTVEEDAGFIYVGVKNPIKRRVWKCKCDCGNYTIKTTNVLERGLVSSCGLCELHSNGEYKIESLLLDNNIIYEKQKTFKTCKDKHVLPFDFYLPEYNCLIEYDGTSHYTPNKYGSWNTEENLKITQYHDAIKNNWCKNNNILLIRIPYTHYKELKIEDLIPDLSDFIV